MHRELPKRIKSYANNIFGYRGNRKIVVFESDDWGAARTSGVSALNDLKRLNLRVDDCHYTKYDALASRDDLEALFETLAGVTNSLGKSPTLTANCLTSNPDFEKIANANFEHYYFEDFRDTLSRYPKHAKSFESWRQGMASGLFHPQFHGREHLNLSRWMKALKEGDEITRKAFDLGIFGISSHILPSKRTSHLAAFDGRDIELTFDRKQIVKQGLQQFKDIFGYSSLSMIAPNYVWDKEIEQAAFNGGVRYIQSSNAQQVSSDFSRSKKIIRHYMGQKNSLGQTYLVRNCHFEPSSNQNKDWVDSCMNEIKIAFAMRKPAIISTHRVNYISFIENTNRDRNLPMLRMLLKKMVKHWPDITFMTSDELGEYIINRRTYEG